jgi:hypothetical protein
MRLSSLTKATAVLCAVAFVTATAGTAQAAPVDKDNGKCRGTIGKNVAKLGSTISKAFDGCIKSAAKTGSGNCSTTAAADTKGKVPGTKSKFADAVGGAKSKCDDTTHAVTLAEHQICGTPNGSAIATFANVSACLNDIVDKNIERWRNAILSPDFAGLAADKDANSCAGAIGKNATKLFATIQKEHSKAVKGTDKAGADSGYVNPGATSKISSARTKLDAGLDKACTVLTPAQWALIGSCDDDLAGAKECIKDKTTAAAEGLIASAYDQPGSCPTQVQVKIHHGSSDGAKLGPTELDVGTTGIGHNADVVDGFVGRVDLDCGAAPNDCTSCVATSNCSEGNCRCSNDNSILCSTPFVEDTCGGGNTCQLFFGPPLPLSAGGTPTCVVNRINSELVNTANVATGESDTQIDNQSIVHLGISASQPCPTCSGAALGVAGTCDGGERNGMACTTDAISDLFGNTSYSCPPALLSNIGNLKIALNLSDSPPDIGFDLPCDPPIGVLFCSCSTCTGDNTIGCNSDAECAAAAAGTCRTDGLHGGLGRKPNACNDGTCEAGVGNEGICTGDTDAFCDGYVKANGGGIISCLDDSGCDALDGECPGGDCGTCTLNQQRVCFLDPIVATGSPDPEGAVLASNFCTSPTSNGGVNGAVGSPGPARVTLDFEFVGYCPNGTDIWGSGGANCQ